MTRRGLLTLLGTAARAQQPWAQFVDIAARAGLTHPVIYGGVDTKKYILETNGCGVAFFDYDHDGWLDIFVPGGSRIDRAPTGTTCRLYKNNRDGTFTDVTKKAGLERVAWVSGVCIGDYNNDGLDDLFLSCWGQNILYRNNGDGTFTDVTERAGLLRPRDPRWGAGCTFVDYNRDGYLDLFVSEYLKFDFDKVPAPGQSENCNWKGVPVNCGPKGLPTGRNLLYRNNGNGTFTDVSEASGIAKVAGRYGMTAVAADFDDDGWPDIFVACDSTASILYKNQHDGTFVDVALEAGVAYNEDGREQAGMGVAVGDFQNRGRLDLFKTHFADDTPVLYVNQGGQFDDRTTKAGLGVFTRYVGWGTVAADFDNDGNLDLLFVNGNVYPEVEQRLPEYPYKNPRMLLRNRGNGAFADVSATGGPGIAARHSSRGCAVGDIDNDGQLEVLILNMNEPPSLLKNEVKTANRWLKVKLVGTKSNRSGIGANVWVTAVGRRQRQDVLSQSSFYSQNDLRLHFGLGTAEKAELVEIRWPSGLREAYRNVTANQIVTWKEGAGTKL